MAHYSDLCVLSEVCGVLALVVEITWWLLKEGKLARSIGDRAKAHRAGGGMLPGTNVHRQSKNERVPMSKAFRVQFSHRNFVARHIAFRFVISGNGSIARFLREASFPASDDEADFRRP